MLFTLCRDFIPIVAEFLCLTHSFFMYMKPMKTSGVDNLWDNDRKYNMVSNIQAKHIIMVTKHPKFPHLMHKLSPMHINWIVYNLVLLGWGYWAISRGSLDNLSVAVLPNIFLEQFGILSWDELNTIFYVHSSSLIFFVVYYWSNFGKHLLSEDMRSPLKFVYNIHGQNFCRLMNMSPEWNENQFLKDYFWLKTISRSLVVYWPTEVLTIRLSLKDGFWCMYFAIV